MQPRLEEFLARLLTDPELRRRFVADAAMVAVEHGLSPDECRAVAMMSAQDLATAARSFEHKRNAKAKRRGWWFKRLFQWGG
jgi:hypothetical protein